MGVENNTKLFAGQTKTIFFNTSLLWLLSFSNMAKYKPQTKPIQPNWAFDTLGTFLGNSFLFVPTETA